MGIFNLTESEKKEILSLHNNAKVIKEQAENQQATPTTQPLNPVDKIKLIQTTLKTKYNVELGKTGSKGDGVDGALGPKTLDAIAKVIKSKSGDSTQQVDNSQKTDTTQQAATATQTTPTQLSSIQQREFDMGLSQTPATQTSPATQIQQGTTTQQLTPKQNRQARRAQRRAQQ